MVSAFILAIQFPKVWEMPPRAVVLWSAATVVAFFVMAELFQWRAESKERRNFLPNIEKAMAHVFAEHHIPLKELEKADKSAATVELIEKKGTEESLPVIKAQFVRVHLMPRSVWQGMAQEIMAAVGRTDDYETEADFLCELYLVNTTDNPVTIRKFVCESQIGSEKKKMPQIEDLSDYQIEPPKEEGQRFEKVRPNKDLADLSAILKDKALTRGVGYRGWVRFRITGPKSVFDTPVLSEVTIVDALGGKHPISPLEPFDTSEGTLVHNPSKAFD